MSNHDDVTTEAASSATIEASSGESGPIGATGEIWRDTSRPVSERVAALVSRLSLDEKIAQLYGVWVGVDDTGDVVAPYQDTLSDGDLDWETMLSSGLGQLTRPLGTAPVDPAVGARALAQTQSKVTAANRFAIPALVHEECLTGFMAWGATVYPTPLAWGATFNPELVTAIAAEIGAGLRTVGVHQGLAPVLDVTRDPRWGRTEETIGEDPFLVATIGTAYVRGLESTGIVATLKHFAGYSGSRGARNLGPVSVGRRELADVLLLPFEMAIRDGRARAVMHSYSEIDGVPAAADEGLLTGVLRDEWGFTGTVVADYFGISFLELLHGVAADAAEAAGLALAAGVDVELPTVRCYGDPLREAVRDGRVPEALVDRAVSRVLRQKCELGLLDPDWNPFPAGLNRASEEQATAEPARAGVEGTIDLDPPHARARAREIAEQSIVLAANDGTLPLPERTRLALVGPLADDATGMLGCYSFPGHVGRKHPDVAPGVDIPTLTQALREVLPEASISHATGCGIDDADTTGIAAAVDAAASADVCVAVVGDRADLFGRGTSGEGCDAEDLQLPGVQAELLHALLRTGTPVVLVVLAGRPYALGAFADRLAAVVQAFFPGEEGGPALARVLTGEVSPSGRLPVAVPHSPGGQPYTYLTPRLGQATKVSSIDPTPLYPFGHGLTYTEFAWDDVRVDDQPVSTDQPVECATDGSVKVSVQVANIGDRAGTELVQLYLHDPVAQVTRPVIRLIGYVRVPLDPGQRRRVTFTVHADLSAFVGRHGDRVVEPGALELRLSTSSARCEHAVPVHLVGPERVVGHRRRMVPDVTITEPDTPQMSDS